MEYPGKTSVYNEDDVRSVIPESHVPVIEVWAPQFKRRKSYWQIGTSFMCRVKMSELAENVRIDTDRKKVIRGTATENFEPIETLGTIEILLFGAFPLTAYVTASKNAAPLVVGGIFGSDYIRAGFWIFNRQSQILRPCGNYVDVLRALPGSSYIPDYVTKLRDAIRKIKADKEGVWATVSGRMMEIRRHLRADLRDDNRPSVINLLNDYTDCFYLPGDKIPATKLLKYSMKTKNNDIISIRQPSVPLWYWNLLDKVVSDLLRQGVLRVSTSPYNFPIGLEEKKPDARGKIDYRLFANFSRLNNLMELENVPIPNIIDVVDELYGSKYFTVMDLASASYHIPLEAQDCRRTAFSVRSGRYEFLRVPCALKNGRESVQRLMNLVFQGMKNKVCVACDDILVHTRTFEDHEVTVRKVLDRVRRHGLKLRPGKCQMFQKSVIYLGFSITDEGLLPDPAKIEKLRASRPTTSEELRSYLGLLSTHKQFIPRYASRAKPLWDLVKERELSWTPETLQIFNDFRNILSSPLILRYPNWDKPFSNRSGFEEHGISARVVQRSADDNSVGTIVWASRTYTPAERLYNIKQRENLALTFAADEFRRYMQNTTALDRLAQSLSIKH